MGAKQKKLQQALERAQAVLSSHRDINAFMSFKGDRNQFPSIEEVLKEPRKWPGAEPLWGVTQSWKNFQDKMKDPEENGEYEKLHKTSVSSRR